MQESVIIREIGVYHPTMKLSNEELLKHFKSIGKDEKEVGDLLEAIGRNERYIAEKGETTLSMAIEASKTALEKANLTGADMDVIVFSSGTPEYLIPPNSAMIHSEIQGKREAIVYDSNTACVGMLVSVDQVSKSLLGTPGSKYALIVGAERMFHYADKDDPFTYGGFGDASCAVILEKVEGEGKGVIDTSYNTNTQYNKDMVFPACGMSNILDENVPEKDKLFIWGRLHSGEIFKHAPIQITGLLEKHQLTTKDIKQYLCTQVSVRAVKKMLQTIEDDLDKFYIIGDEYGYTGTSSPFIALQKAVESGNVQRGDHVMFWSLGAGYSACALLMKY